MDYSPFLTINLHAAIYPVNTWKHLEIFLHRSGTRFAHPPCYAFSIENKHCVPLQRKDVKTMRAQFSQQLTFFTSGGPWGGGDSRRLW